MALAKRAQRSTILPGSSSQTRQIELDFVRGIAILLVLDYHSSASILNRLTSPPGRANIGWIGVDVFFVLSGFLVGGLLCKEWKLRGKIDRKRFLVRRAFKIWPQYYIFIAASIALGPVPLRTGWSQILNVQNYFPCILHTWSLAVEEHVYLFLLLCFWVAATWKLSVWQLFTALTFVIIGVVLLRHILEMKDLPIYFGTHTRMDGILYGVLLALLYHGKPEHFNLLRSWRAFWLGLLFLSAGMVTGIGRHVFSLAVRIDAANILAIAILMLIYRRQSHARFRGVAYKSVAWIGVYSYGIYLWHVNVFALSERLCQRIKLPFIAVAMLNTASAVACGFITTRVIELPLLTLRDRLFPKRVDSAVGIPAELESGGR